MDTTVKTCILNVKGLFDKHKRQQVFYWLQRNKYDICLLQEIHCRHIDFDLWDKETIFTSYFSGNSSHCKEVGILTRTSDTLKITQKKMEGRIQSLLVTYNEIKLNIINVYGPNTDDQTFHETLKITFQTIMIIPLL